MKFSVNSPLSFSFAAVGLAVASSIAVSSPAHAFTSCATAIANDVTDAVGCGIGTANQDAVSPNSPLTVNTEKFFGFTDWKFSAKVGEGVLQSDTNQGSGQSGSWNLASIFNPAWQDVMLVFKSGQGTRLVGYLLGDNVSSGTWNTPFEKSVFGFNGGNTRDVSHISVYYREGNNSNTGGNSAAVPEPTTMAGIALAGAGLAAYRRRRAVAK